jgi:hypothetical protein
MRLYRRVPRAQRRASHAEGAEKSISRKDRKDFFLALHAPTAERSKTRSAPKRGAARAERPNEVTVTPDRRAV